MKKKRPVNLDLWTIKFPLIAIASILHRISGFIIFLLLPLLLWILQLSLDSAAGFAAIGKYLQQPILKFIIWVSTAAMMYHFFAGIRHLMADIGVAETVSSARFAVIIVFVLTIIFLVVAGWWLW